MKSTYALLAMAGLAACNADIPTDTDSSAGPLFARGGGSQTLYGITLAGGLQNDLTRPFSAMGVTGNPFSAQVSADPVYLTLPASGGGNDLTACDGDGSLGPSTVNWGGYGGVWKGNFSVTGKKAGSSYHVAFGATREDGTGFLWLVINATGVKSNNNLTLSFTNVRGLVSAGSTPDGGAGRLAGSVSQFLDHRDAVIRPPVSPGLPAQKHILTLDSTTPEMSRP